MPGVCRACSADDVSMKCGGCKSTFYCDRECQLKDWRQGHKHECKLLQNRNKQYSVKEKFEFTLPSLNDESKALIRVEKVKGKGYGVIANCNIKRGTVIYREKPLIVVPNEVSTQIFEKSVKQQFDGLSKAQQNVFKSLSSNHLASILPVIAMGQSQELMTIAMNNKIELLSQSDRHGAPNVSGVFPLISRINHSCECNVHWQWIDQCNEERLIAVCDIHIGSELSACYLADNFYQRKKRLKAFWNIECQCDWCKTGEKESVLKRYQEMNDILPTMGSNPIEGYKMSKELIKMTVTHLNSHPNNLHRHYYDAAQFALGLQRWSEAAHYLELHMKEKRVAQGRDAVMDILFKAKVEMLPKKFRFKFKKYEKPGLLKHVAGPEMKEQKKAKPSRKVQDNNQQKRKKASKKQKKRKRRK